MATESVKELEGHEGMYDRVTSMHLSDLGEITQKPSVSLSDDNAVIDDIQAQRDARQPGASAEGRASGGLESAARRQSATSRRDSATSSSFVSEATRRSSTTQDSSEEEEDPEDVPAWLNREQLAEEWFRRKTQGNVGFGADIQRWGTVSGPSKEFLEGLTWAKGLLNEVHTSLNGLHAYSVDHSAVAIRDEGDKEGDLHSELLWRARQKGAQVGAETFMLEQKKDGRNVQFKNIKMEDHAASKPEQVRRELSPFSRYAEKVAQMKAEQNRRDACGDELQLSDLHELAQAEKPLTINIEHYDYKSGTRSQKKLDLHGHLGPEATILDVRKTVCSRLSTNMESVIIHTATGSLPDDHVTVQACAKPLSATVSHPQHWAIASNDGSVQVIDAHTDVVVHKFPHHCHVNCLDWNSNGTKLASGAGCGTVRVFDIAAAYEELQVDMMHAVLDLKWHPMLAKLAAAVDDKTVRILDVNTGAEEMRFRHSLCVSVVAWHPSGTKVVTGCDDDFCRVIELSTGKEARTFKHVCPISAVASSPCGQWVATGSKDAVASVFNITSGACLVYFKHRGPVTDIVWSKEGGRMATASKDGCARIFSIDEHGGRLEATLTHKGEVNSVDFNPRGTKLLTASLDGYVRVFDVLAKAEETHFNHGRFVHDARWRPFEVKMDVLDS
eukprot:TRINITY_DN8230_c0_g1_i1.p1 TRINITY_DN8230_c0_g1~~TRINITY_DN8230_c0_g1_i1.p1  ORF type:complete len:670 (+),score=133.10 TRINITY_DN8230_c0_g1_i1:191-2200(+)